MPNSFSRLLVLSSALLLPALPTASAADPVNHQITLPPDHAWCSDEMISGLLDNTNSFRAQNGLPALKMDTVGMKVAEMRAVQFSQYMNSHTGAEPGFNPHTGYDTTAAALGYNIVGENLAFSATNATYVVYGLWQTSPLHRAALLTSRGNVAGVSCVRAAGTFYWTYNPGYNAATPAPAPVPAPNPALDSEQSAFLTLINAYRAQNGAGPLQISTALQTAAQWMSNDAAAHNSAGHIDSLGRNTGARLAAFGYVYSPWGENTAGGFGTAQSVFDAWRTYCDPDSSGACTYAHRLNMLNPSFQAIGIGRAYGTYWTTAFGGFVEQSPSPTPTPTPTPTSKLLFNAPTNGQTISGTFYISASVTGSAGVGGVSVAVDGKAPFAMYPSSTGYVIGLNTRVLPDGRHTLTLSTTDATGRAYTASIAVTVANSASTPPPTPTPTPTPPPTPTPTPVPVPSGALSFVSPRNGQTISGLFYVSATATIRPDSNGVRLSIDDGAARSIYSSASGYTAGLNTSTLKDGLHTLTLYATDLNNRQYTAKVTVTVANNNPAPVPAPVPTPTPTPTPVPAAGLSFLAPVNGQTLSGIFYVNAALSSRPDENGIRLSIDGKPSVQMYSGSTGFVIGLNTPILQNGSHTLTISATDQNNRAFSASIAVIVKNPQN